MLPPGPDHWSLEQVTQERIDAIAGFGFTERQARFLVTAILNAGVFVERQYCAFAGIAHGQKTHDFLTRLTDGRYATAVSVGPLHAGRLFHIHHKPLYAAIGQPDSRYRKPAALARLIERVMLLDAVLAAPDLDWLATERDKVAYFKRRVGDRVESREFPRLVFGTPPLTTTRYFPDKLPIGVSRDQMDHVFLYLVTKIRPAPVDFRMFLWRHSEILRAIDRWTIRLLAPRSRSGSFAVHLNAAREELASPLHPAAVEELAWYFAERKRLKTPGPRSTEKRFHDDANAYRSPRFRVMYRRWLEEGDPVLWAARSPALKDALERGFGRVEYVSLPHQYLHLTGLVGTA